VNAAAKVRNSGAAHCYFGRRLGLFEAIVEHIIRMTPEEMDCFAQSVASDPDILLHEVARFLSPFFVMRGTSPRGRDALMFLSQFSSNDPTGAALWQVALGEEERAAAEVVAALD
jgi:AcrR family transcriptional regulator